MYYAVLHLMSECTLKIVNYAEREIPLHVAKNDVKSRLLKAFLNVKSVGLPIFSTSGVTSGSDKAF